MRFASLVSLAVVLAIPLIVAIYTRRRRLPVRRVAGVFLWREAIALGTPSMGEGHPSRSALVRDISAAALLALLACDRFAGEPSDLGEFTQWFLVAGRALICVAIVGLLLANWRMRSRA